MKPRYNDPKTPDPEQLRRELVRLVQQLGDFCVSKDLGDFDIGTTETPIPHGLPWPPKRWAACNQDASVVIRQTRRPDERYVFLVADSAVRAGIVVW